MGESPMIEYAGRLVAGSKVDVLSIDVFDTAVQRDLLAPTHLFAAVETEFAKKFGVSLAKGAAELRIAAEDAARLKISAREDISIDDIRSEMLVLRKEYTSEQVQWFIEKEIELELACVSANSDIFALYQAAIEKGLRVFFVSDMYLPEQVIRKILHRCGYREFEKLFVSSETGLTKRTGNAFSLLIREAGIDPRKILHVGDQLEGDFQAPKKKGMSAALYKPDYARITRRVKSSSGVELVSRAVKRVIHEAKDASTADRYRIYGREVGVFLVYPWMRWLEKKTIEHQIDKMVFLARDGYLPKKIFDLRASRGPHSPAGAYLEVSRRPLNLAKVTKVDEKSFQFLCSGEEGISPLQILDRLGLPLEVAQDRKLWSAQKLIRTEEQRDELFFSMLNFEGDVVSACHRVRDRVKGYLNTKFPLEGKNVGIVDLGWRGTLQDGLEDVLRRECHFSGRLIGCYFGLIPGTDLRESEFSLKEGFSCQPGTARTDYQSLLIPLMEVLLGAPEGSTCDYEDELLVFRPKYVSNSMESAQYQDRIRHFQDGVLGALSLGSDSVLGMEEYLETDRGANLSLGCLKILGALEESILFSDLSDLRHWDGLDHNGPGIRLKEHPGMPWRQPTFGELFIQRAKVLIKKALRPVWSRLIE